jgi:hypothetical protein
VLLASAAAVIWAQVAVAALTVCLNESPALTAEMAAALPVSSAVANWLLPLFARLGVVAAASSPGANWLLQVFAPLDVSSGAWQPTCDPTAHARAMAVAGLGYVVAIVVLDRGRVSARLSWPLVIGGAALMRLALFFMPGLLSSDIIDYASHGRVASLHAANPYVQTPSQFPADPLSSLGAWPTVVTVYGPLWTHVDAAVTGLLPNASLVQLVFAYKLVGLVADLASVVVLFSIARRWQSVGATAVTPLVAVAMWLWNPLVDVELIGNAHNEALMIALVLAGLALLTHAVITPERSRAWFGAMLAFWLGALVKFVPLALVAISALAWLRLSNRRLGRIALLVVAFAAISLVVAAPWLDSPAVAAPIVGLASGGQRFKDVWQDAPAAWLTVRVVPLLGVPDHPATLRMDVARVMVYSLTRLVLAAYVLAEAWLLWRRLGQLRTQPGPVLATSARSSVQVQAGPVLRAIALASMRVLLLALLLYTSQVYAWYFLWPLPLACLLGPRNAWSRAVVVFGLVFLPAYYLREFAPYGVFEMPRYAEIALAILAVVWLGTHMLTRTSPLQVRAAARVPDPGEAVRS